MSFAAHCLLPRPRAPGHRMLNVSVVNSLIELDSLRLDWDRLAAGHWMRSWDWQSQWIETYQGKGKLRVLVAEEGSQIVGIFPLFERYRSWTGRTLEMVGSDKICSDDLGILCHERDGVRVAEAFANFMLGSHGLRWDYMDLDGIRVDNGTMSAFAEALQSLQPVEIDRRTESSCWLLKLQPGPDGNHIWSARLRKTIKLAEQEREAGILGFRTASTPEQATDDLEIIEELHQARWKSVGVSGCFANDQFTRFVSAYVSKRWSAEHEIPTTVPSVMVSTLTWEGNAAAGALSFVNGNTLSIYLTAMNPKHAEIKPGWKLQGFLINQAARNGLKYVDYMRGDEEYKQRLRCEPTQQQRWLIPSPRILGRVRKAVYETAKHLRNRLRAQSAPMESEAPTQAD
jgi:CelD/BcsL family acetyltransferase involved in cellulose biosynthesis